MTSCPQFRAKLVPPAMVEAIPARWQPEEATLQGVLEGVPVEWGEQKPESTKTSVPSSLTIS
jgi:hypothetical protein